MAETIASVTIQMRDQISPGLATAADGVGEVRTEIKELGAAVDRVDREMADLGDAAGKTGGSVAKVAGAISLLSPEAASGAMAVADLADVVEVASGAMKAMGLSLGSTLAILLPVAVAVGALALAWNHYAGELADAEADQERQVTKLEEFLPLAEAVKRAKEDLAFASGTMTQAERDLAEAQRQSDAMVAEASVTLRKHREEVVANLAEEQRLVSEGYLKHQAAVEDLEGELAGLDEELGRVRASGEAFVTTTVEAAENARLAADAERHYQENLRKREAAVRDAAKAEAEAARVLAEALAAQADFEARMSAALQKRLGEEAAAFDEMVSPAVDRAAEFLREFTDELEGIVPPDAETDLEALVRLEDELALSLSRNVINLADYTTQMELLAAARKKLTDLPDPVEGAANAANMAAGGPSAVMGAVASAGPWGAIIAALVDVVGNFGDLGDMFNDFTANFQESLMDLPETLAANLGKWLETAIRSVDIGGEFIQGLADMLPSIFSTIADSLGTLIGALVEALLINLPKAVLAFIGVLLDPNTWIDIVQAFVKALVAAFKGIFTGKDDGSEGSTGVGALSGVGKWWDKTWANLTNSDDYVGSHAVGSDYVHRTGLSLVHEGERIEPATGAGSGRAAMAGRSSGGAGGNVYLHISGFAIGTVDEFMREINRVLGDTGRQLAWAA